MRRRNYSSRICIKNDEEMGVETWRTLLHYKQDSHSKDTNPKVPYLSSFSLSLSLVSSFFRFFSCGFLSVGYGHATRHRWFVTAQRQSYLVVVVVVAWVPCGALPNAKVHCGAIFVCCHCDDKATEKAKEEEGMTEYNEKGGGKKK